MRPKFFKDGYEVGQRRPLDPGILRRAIRDCKEMGWDRLCSYFEGQLEATIAKPESRFSP